MPRLGQRKKSAAPRYQTPPSTEQKPAATLDEFWELRDRLLRAQDEMEAAATEFDRLTEYGAAPLTPAIRQASAALSDLYRAHAQDERAWIAVAYRLPWEDRAVVADWYGQPLFDETGAVASFFHFWSQGPAMQVIAPYRRLHGLFP